MSYEQATHSFVGSQPLTPVQTPVVGPGEEHGFSFLHEDTSFYEPRLDWDAPHLPAGDRHSDKFGQETGAATPRGIKTQREPGHNSTQAKGLSVNASLLLNTPNFALLSPQFSSPRSPVAEESARHMDSAVRTPPPAKASGSKKKEKQGTGDRAHRADGSNRQILPKPSEASSSNLPPQTPGQQFSPLEFGTPDIFSGNFDLQANSAVYPQQRLFWDSTANNDFGLDFTAENPFATPKGQGLEPFVSHQETTALPQGTFLDFSQDLAGATFMPDAPPGSTHGITSSFGHGVDPTLLLSSPGGRNDLALAQVASDTSLQPYAYQLQEARRDKAVEGPNKNRKRRKPSVDSPAVAAALETLRDNRKRPVLRRSMTDTQLAHSGGSSASSSRAGTSHGRSSPLKQHRSESVKRRKMSFGLVIGADGKARVESIVRRPGSLSSATGDDSQAEHTTHSSDSESTEAADSDLDEGNYSALATSFGGEPGGGVLLPRLGRFGSSSSHSQRSSYGSHYSSGSEPSRASRPKKKASSSSSTSVSTAASNTKRQPRHILDPVREGGSFEDESTSGGDSAQRALMHSLNASQRGRYSPQKRGGGGGGLEPFVSSAGLQTSMSSVERR